MRAILQYFLIFISLLITTQNHAYADLLLSVGVGRGIFEQPGTPFERVAEVGYRQNLSRDFFLRGNALYFSDLSGGGHLSSLYTGVLGGVRAQSASGVELHIGFGPGYLWTPDNVLGGHFQFNLEGGVGIPDGQGGQYLGLVWDHLSSAGIEMPNDGRDFIMVQWEVMRF